MPTISDLKDQARTLEQQGQIDRALTIYQHILKHLEGTPAITKVLPLYVKAGDLLHKLERSEEAVASYQTAAELYASTGAATRVTALCGKILRLVPERNDVYTDFVRQLIEHGHVGSARDVLADYARLANMDRALETLDDLAGRPNSEVEPMLERLLDSFELNDQPEQAAARVSSHLEQVTDDLAGELSRVPEPLTPPMLDLDNLPRQSSLYEAIREADGGNSVDTDADAPADTPDEEPADTDTDTPEAEHESAIEITRDVTPTMESVQPSFVTAEETPVEDTADSDDELDSLLAEAIAAEDTGEEAADTTDTPGAVDVKTSHWTPDFTEPKAEETVATEWAPEEELKPAARYPSDEYDTPDIEDESAEDVDEAAEEAEEEPPEPVEQEPEAPIEAVEPAEPFRDEPTAQVDEEFSTPPVDTEPPPEPMRRPSRPPRMMLPRDSDAKPKSPLLFGIGGLIVGALAGAGLTFVLLSGGSDSPPTVIPEQQPAVDTPATPVGTPSAAELEPAVALPVAPEPVDAEIPEVDTNAVLLIDSAETAQTGPGGLEEAGPDSAVTGTESPQTASSLTSAGNPIVVDGMEIEEISEIEYRGQTGYRVVHLLEWGDPIVIEAYSDTTVTLSARIQVTVTPPDTVVGIRRLEGYMVYASGVMPEDSLRSLMMRLVEGERQN